MLLINSKPRQVTLLNGNSQCMPTKEIHKKVWGYLEVEHILPKKKYLSNPVPSKKPMSILWVGGAILFESSSAVVLCFPHPTRRSGGRAPVALWK